MAKTAGTTNDPRKAWERITERFSKGAQVGTNTRLTIEWAVKALGMTESNPADVLAAYFGAIKTGQDSAAVAALASESPYVKSRLAVQSAIESGYAAQAEFNMLRDSLAALPSELSAPVLAAKAELLGLTPDGLPTLPTDVSDELWPPVKITKVSGQGKATVSNE